MHPSTDSPGHKSSGDDPSNASMQRPPFGNDCYTKAARTCVGSFQTPLGVGAELVILWSFGTTPPPTASRVCQVVRWTPRRNHRQCLLIVGSNWATAVPVASTAWVVIVQPSTEMAEPSTEMAEPGTGTVVEPSMAEAPLDLEDKTTTERTYIVVYANKQV